MMNEINEMSLTPDYVNTLAGQHNWAATGVSDYPPRDPLVGQSKFFNRYRTFIKTVDHDDDKFAHVFAIEGEWGRGKSRLGYELISQINDCSKGWYVRNSAGALDDAQLFDDEARRDEYLGLYIRYSQIASKFQNTDNWFGFGLYKALMPMATNAFDGSIQGQIAQQALKRLEPMGFQASHLATLLQLDQGFSDEDLYYDQARDDKGQAVTVTQLVDAAYQYLNQFGIRYVLVVLDELETVAEAATYGIDRDDACQLDGEAIRLIGKAIKEEDPRRKLPWLRYVALCSPLLGQQLREIQSTARRFELVELENNAFADVSDYVEKLQGENRLRHAYPRGLVQAAYAMSGANFGWFNVVMANIDVVLDGLVQSGQGTPSIGELFGKVLENSGRVSTHVLDHNAIGGIQTKDLGLRQLARGLLFGQLPLPLAGADPKLLELLPLTNEYDEPVVSLYRLVNWEMIDCRQALEHGKFQRDRDEWFYPSVDQGLNLQALRQNLRTFSINESGDDNTLLIPLALSEFRHLIGLLYSHPAAEFAADALWSHFFGEQKQLDNVDKTHIGPSIAMLLRLDMRYRSQQQNSMIFREPGYADAHEQAMAAAKKSWERETLERNRTRLLGLFRLLDRDWSYNQAAFPSRENLAIQMTASGRGRGMVGGLQYCDGLKLHPSGKAAFAWIDSKDELNKLNDHLAATRPESGRMPVMAFTGSIGVNDEYVKGSVTEALKDNILLYYLNTSEIDVLERIGLDAKFCQGFELNEQVFTIKFKNRLDNICDFAYKRIHEWRHRLDRRGLIAWPLRPSGRINNDDRTNLFKAWKLLTVEQPSLQSLNEIMPEHQLDAADVRNTFSRLSVTSKVLSQGYQASEHSGLFIDIEQPNVAQARVPAFLVNIANPRKGDHWTLEKASQHWYWGYLWSPASTGLTAKAVFDDWMWWCSQLNLLQVEDRTARKEKWIPVTRSALEDGALGYAKSWFFDKGEGHYRDTVSNLIEVFGDDKVPGLFAWTDAAKVGTATTTAKEHLEQAESLMVSLRNREENLPDDVDEMIRLFPLLLKERSDILRHIRCVKDEQDTRIELRNERIIRLEDESQSLYSRIELARQFAAFVVTASQRVEQAALDVITDIESEKLAKAPFPRRMFTLSLECIRNILEGATNQGENSATQIREARGSSDTLRFYLRTLQLDNASERLEKLAIEVGMDIRSGVKKPTSEINGYIMQAYRKMLELYAKAKAEMTSLEQRIDVASQLLGDTLPADYPKPEHPKLLLRLNQQRLVIEDALQDLEEKVDLFYEKYTEEARNGIFSAIRDEPERLMKMTLEQLGVLSGRIREVETAISRYRIDLLESANTQLRPQIAPLMKAMNQPPVEVISLDHIKHLPLHELIVELDCRHQHWRDLAQSALSGTGITVERWSAIADELLARQQPTLSAEEQQALVNKGILKLQFTFGGEL
ncbi:hypothetical protein [Photobacterium sp. OFAV2-7]|uniref:hypothetical protein n=1 Tax=Photobacterium sp. OFAV2-7 TaxID=2917748 RepID=UPI001EF51AA3|nr:hypothetical protein [Photobacterium sp. OFAV2-7]MCG7584798.1 hypothetical protein [Photobacterium sp. OFAV2-7]